MPADELGTYMRECFHKAYGSLEESGVGWTKDDAFSGPEVCAIDYLVDELKVADTTIVQDLLDESGLHEGQIMDGDYDELDSGLSFYFPRNDFFGEDRNRLVTQILVLPRSIQVSGKKLFSTLA